MKKKFKDLYGNDFEVDFEKHDISKYDVLYHVTLKKNKKQIEQRGLLRNQLQHKSLVETGLIFLSYPIDKNTSDCFRWRDETCSLVILDAKQLNDDEYVFYNDYFGREDISSKRNHICCDSDIPLKYIKKILEF